MSQERTNLTSEPPGQPFSLRLMVPSITRPKPSDPRWRQSRLELHFPESFTAGPLLILTAATGNGRRGSLGPGAGRPNQRGRGLPVEVPSLTLARFCGGQCPLGPPGKGWQGLAPREGSVHASLGETGTTSSAEQVPGPLEEIPSLAPDSPIPGPPPSAPRLPPPACRLG